MRISIQSQLVVLDPGGAAVVEIPSPVEGSVRDRLWFQTVERFNQGQVEVITVIEAPDEDG